MKKLKKIFREEGVPKIVQSDNGKEFKSQTFDKFMADNVVEGKCFFLNGLKSLLMSFHLQFDMASHTTLVPKDKWKRCTTY